MKYKFETDLENNLMSMAVVSAHRFCVAVQEAMRVLEREAGCYGLKEEDYYLEAKEFLERLVGRLAAKPGKKLEQEG